MKKILTVLALALSVAAFGQNKTFKQELIESGYIHKPLPVHSEQSVEAFGLTKKVLDSRVLCDMETADAWKHFGHGQLTFTTERSIDGTHSLRLTAPSMPEKGPGMGRGNCEASIKLDGEDWTGYNRIHFFIYPACEGMHSIYVNIGFTNDGEVKVPDPFGREGVHEVNLVNNQWNDCTLEFPELPRDKITKLKFWLEIFGQELTQGDSLQIDIDHVVLEKIEQPEVAKGWQPGDGRIVLSNTGYTPEASKVAVLNVPSAKKFELRSEENGKVVFKGDIKTVTTTTGTFQTADFTAFKTPGRYILKAGGKESFPFNISKDVWEDSAWRMINFLFCERCGYPVPGKHGECHGDLHAVVDGKTYQLNGGWHDAGDMAQQVLQTGEISYSLLQMAQTAKARGNKELYARLVEEAMWGMDFVLRSRFGEGKRMVSWGTNLWTDRILGTSDDAGSREIYVTEGGYDNFVLAGIEAYTAMVLEDDPEMVNKLTRSAREDFGWALERYKKYGFKELLMSKRVHTKNTTESQYNASVSWAASMLYKLTGDKQYAEQAVSFIQLPLDCQRTEAIGEGLKGFFYGDPQHLSGVHFNHKSRDYAFAEALDALIQTQPEHKDAAKWKNSLTLYGQFLKDIMRYVEPYGMIPSGVYNIHEVDHMDLFMPWQLGANEKNAKPLYEAQLAQGYKLDDEYVLKRFPVWYSFRGNTVVSLSTGKAAAICARALGDPQLKQIAEQQLAWVVGANPFGQSIIYGEGAFWGQMYCALPGEMTGEIPVGIQSYDNEDTPYWPQFNIATPKEVFGLTASRWLMLIAEF